MFIQRGNNNFEIEIAGAAPFSNTYSLDFDGVDDYVSTNSKIIGSDITLSGWVNFNGSYSIFTPQFPMSITPSNTTAPNETLGRFYKNSRGLEIIIQCFDQNGANFSTYAVNSFDFEGAGWQHVCWTYNVTTKHIYVYINGVAQTWIDNGGTIITPYLTAVGTRLYESDLTIGRVKPATSAGNYLGLVDEVSTYNRILTQEEITSISSAPTDLTSLAPVVWLRNGDNGSYKSPQWLLPSNENKDKVSNYSFELDGIDDYVSITPNPLTDFTVSFWIKPSSGVSASFDGILGQGTTSAQGGILRYVAYDGTTTVGNVLVRLASWTNVSGTVTNGVWTNIVLTYDSVADELKGYNNGSLYTTISNPDFSAQTTNAHSFERIGLRNGLSGSEFNGGIDEVAVWDSALTDISSIYNGGTPTTLPSGAVAHWRMGEDATFSGGVWTVPDAIGSNDGTSNAMTIEDRVGEAPNSENNALSINMDLVDRTTDVPT